MIDKQRYEVAISFLLPSTSSLTSIITVEKVEKEPRNPVPMTVTDSADGDPPRRTPNRKEAIIFATKVPAGLLHLPEF